MSIATAAYRSRLRPTDILRVGALGLRTRRLRTGLSTLGVAIGIAAMVGVLGLSASSREELQTRIRALGTNLLEVQAGQGFGRGDQTLPSDAVKMVSRIGPVTAVSSIATVDATVRRTDAISEGINGGITVFAADNGLADHLERIARRRRVARRRNEHLPGRGARLRRRPEARDRRCRRRTARADRRRLVRRHRHPESGCRGRGTGPWRDHRHRRRRDLRRRRRHRTRADLRPHRGRCHRRRANRAAANREPGDA